MACRKTKSKSFDFPRNVPTPYEAYMKGWEDAQHHGDPDTWIRLNREDAYDKWYWNRQGLEWKRKS